MRSLLLAGCVISFLSQAVAMDGYVDQDGRPMLGVEMSPVPLSKQAEEGLTVDQGVLLRQVFPNSAAQAMGLQAGDVILTINGSPIGSMVDLRTEIGANNIGDPVQVTVSRGGQRVERFGELREWPQGIPFDPLDPAVEQKFRDWQERRLQRSFDEIDQLAGEIDSISKELEKQTQAGAPKNQAFDELSNLLKLLPAWKASLDFEYDDTLAQNVEVEPANYVAPELADATAWVISHDFDSTAHKSRLAPQP
jgi:membrane-associated protease RseP (regulator of RpoE activity)